MPTKAFFAFVVVPVIEIASIIAMSSWIGGGLTFALILASAALGFLVMRHAGRSWWAGLRASAGAPDAAGVSTPPHAPDAAAFADRGLLFLAGLMLLIPGFVGDVVALFLLVPLVRTALCAAASAWFLRRFSSVTAPGGFVVWQNDDQSGGGRTDSVHVERIYPGEIVAGEVIPDDSTRDANPPPS